MRSSEHGKQLRDADTNNKEERLKTNKLSCGSIHRVHESLDVLVSFHILHVIPHIVGLVVLCAQILLHLLSMHQTHSVREFLVDTLRKWTCEVLSLHEL